MKNWFIGNRQLHVVLPFRRNLKITTISHKKRYYIQLPIASLLTLLFLSFLPSVSFSQQRPLVTENVDPVQVGSLRLEVGVDFLQDKDFPLSGLNGDLTRIGVLGIRLGVAKNVEIQGGGVVQNYLRIDGRYQPSSVFLIISDTATSTKDVGDFFIGTKIRIKKEGKRAPAFGFRFLVELPNSYQARGIGTNQTNFYAMILTDKNIGKLNITSNLGLGVFPVPLKPFTQNDQVLYGISATYKVNNRFSIVSEVSGRQNTRDNPPLGTESDGSARLGFRLKVAGATWDAAGLRGIYKNSASAGMTLGVTFQIDNLFGK